MIDIANLKASLAAEAARHKAEMELKIQKLTALARLIDAEMAVREMEVSREQNGGEP